MSPSKIGTNGELQLPVRPGPLADAIIEAGTLAAHMVAVYNHGEGWASSGDRDFGCQVADMFVEKLRPFLVERGGQEDGRTWTLCPAQMSERDVGRRVILATGPRIVGDEVAVDVVERGGQPPASSKPWTMKRGYSGEGSVEDLGPPPEGPGLTASSNERLTADIQRILDDYDKKVWRDPLVSVDDRIGIKAYEAERVVGRLRALIEET